MSDSDLSGRLPGPVTGRPRRPLSNSASTASWSIRFSLLTMISGACRSSSRFSRLFRLMTRRYRSLRSLVANRPPSSCTIGRRLGGMTGTASSTIPSGEFLVPMKWLTTFSRLIAFWRRVPLVVLIWSARNSPSAGRSEIHQQALDRLGAHAAVEVVAEPLTQAAVDRVVRHELLGTQRLEGRQRVGQVLRLAPGGVGDPFDVALRLAAGGRELRAPDALRLEVAQAVLQLGHPLGDLLVAMRIDLLLLLLEILLDLGEILVPPVLIDSRDDVRGEVDDLLQVLRRQVEQVAQPAGDALEVPDVRDRRGQFDVAHALAADLLTRDLDATALADDPLEPNPLVLAAVALPVPRGTEDALAEQTVLLGLERPVVDGLRLLDLAVGPGPDLIGRRQADPQLVEVVDVEHLAHRPFRVLALVRAHLRAVSQNPLPPARAGTGRSQAPPRPGRRPRRSPASRSPCPLRRAPPRSGRGTASP